MADKPKKVQLDSTMLDSELEELKQLDASISSVIGTAAEMRKKAEAAVIEEGLFVEVPSEVTDNLTQFVAALHNPEALAATDGKVSAHTVDLLNMAVSILGDNVTEARDTAITAWLKANAKDSGPGLEALRKQRDEKATYITSLAVVLKLPAPDLPSAPKSKASRSGTSGGAVKTSGAAYYKIENGEKAYIADSQNKISSVAHYWSAKLCGTDAKLSTDELVAWAKKNFSVDVKQATAWSITNPATGITVGMDVVSAEAPAVETPQAEEEPATK